MTAWRCALPRRNHTRRGFTLFEMLLVLMVLVTAASLAAPPLRRVIQEHQLHQSADLLKVRLTAARVHAIESGLTYQFRFEPGGRMYLVIPSEHDPASAQQSTAAGGTAAPSSTGRWKVGGALSTAVHFDAQGGGNGTANEPIHAAWLADLPQADELQGVNWSAPVYFLPDGSSTGAVVKVLDHRNLSVTLTVRSLTAGVSLTPITREGS